MNQSKKKFQPKLTKEEKKIPIQHLQQNHVASGGGTGRCGYMSGGGVLGGAAGTGELEEGEYPGRGSEGPQRPCLLLPPSPAPQPC